MLFIFERLCLWPFALCAAFRRSLVRRDSHDYYGQSAPRCQLLPKPAFLLRGETTWFSGSYLITGMGAGWLLNTFPQFGGLRTGPLAVSRCLWSPDGTFRFHQPPIFAGLQFSWHHRPCMPAVGWSCLAFANNRLTPAHPVLNVYLLKVDLLLITRSCPLEADQLRVAWSSEPPG